MSAIVPYGVVYPEKYHADRKAAAEIATQLGFNEETFIEVTVQWGDQDPNAHLNNAMYYKYLEAGQSLPALTRSKAREPHSLSLPTGRGAYVRSITRKLDARTAKAINHGAQGRGLVVGQVMNRFERPVYAPDHLLIAHRATQVARKKFVLTSVIVSFELSSSALRNPRYRLACQRAKVCSGEAIMVGFDYDNHKGAELPNGLYALIEREISDAAKTIAAAQRSKAKL
ncbi:BZ3500_MvSof-1268-A1-R1_Chr1-3g02019 [Microbotryum saponariae]|uniref:BZ3500_MvSof-1268-A1-R1_Chr1-3g02019 protein n=1 Tax=Microbotryum saponariae TaxID=289078 RepID=A0A2X0MRS5_9BASI|nr:BZ3500_MvSof-1268-A1-R1_Chr1-3g02019 [Microbotryum saponariae]SCZ95164.1 BZ3501_MvSof-1269-A2-R1_Chr1-3g01621 [Microbotryum saponariae]